MREPGLLDSSLRSGFRFGLAKMEICYRLFIFPCHPPVLSRFPPAAHRFPRTQLTGCTNEAWTGSVIQAENCRATSRRLAFPCPSSCDLCPYIAPWEFPRTLRSAASYVNGTRLSASLTMFLARLLLLPLLPRSCTRC